MKKRIKRTRAKSETFKYVRIALAGILICAFLFWCITETVKRIKSSGQFIVKTIEIDPGISFVRSPTLEKLKGRSIFDVNLRFVQKKLKHQYPQLSRLRIIKKLPDTIYVVARERNAFAQALLRNRNVTIDPDGVVLYSSGEINTNLPFIVGVKSEEMIRPGLSVKGKGIRVALDVIKTFRANDILSGHPIHRIDVKNLSKINLTISDGLRIIIDKQETFQKLKKLEVLLTQGKINAEEVKYVDLRFKEPIIRKK